MTEKKLSLRRGIILALILIVGGVLNLSYLGEIRGEPEFSHPRLDGAYHDYWARALVSGDWGVGTHYNAIADPEIGTSPYFRPPGYPFFLALVYRLFGTGYLAPRLVQIGLGLFNCLLLYWLTRHYFNPRAGLFAAGLLACNWAPIYFAGELQAPVLLISLVLVLLLLLARWEAKPIWGKLFVAGLLLGLGALVRPNLLALVVLIPAWIWWVVRRRDEGPALLWSIGVFALGVVLALAPVTIRNYIRSGEFFLICSNGGVNLYIGNNAGTDCLSPNAPILREVAGLDHWRSSDYPRVRRALEKKLGRPLSFGETSGFFVDQALDYALANPGTTLANVGKKALLFWGPAEISNNRELHFAKSLSPTLALLPGFPLVVTLFFLGLLLVWKDPGRRKSGLLVLVLLVWFLTFLPFFVAGRYRVPLIPLLLVLGGGGLSALVNLFLQRRMLAGFAWLSLGALFLMVANISFISYRPDLARWHGERAIIWRMAGNPEAAIGAYEKALQVAPDTWRWHRGLAEVLAEREQLPGAVEHYLAALRLGPEQAEIHSNLGMVYSRLGKVKEAEGHLLSACRLQPESPKLHFNLACHLYAAGDYPGALTYYLKALPGMEGQARIHRGLGLTLLRLQRKEAASKHLQRAIDLGDEDPELKKYLDWLGGR